MFKIQLGRIIFLYSLTILKSILSLLEFKLGKKSDEYLYVKKQFMDYVYGELKILFKKLEQEELITQCSCGRKTVRKGYKDCPKCGGSGYENK